VFHPQMTDATEPHGLPPAIDRVLRYFRGLSREERMQALVSYSRKLEPLPDRFKELPRDAFTVPECQTRVDIFPEYHDGRMQYFADLDARRSPTIAAVLAILFSAVNGEPPATTLAIPSDIVRQLMEHIGLGARETGLNAIVTRLKRHAAEVERTGSAA
jgi:cysteine desulfuration protein SufE